jgi:PEP-CTERM motif
MRKLQLVAAAAMFAIAGSANAGQLLSATYSQIIQGVPVVVTSNVATGSLTGNTFSLDAGAWFATSFCIVSPNVAACPAGSIAPPPARVTPNPAGPLAAPVVGINVFLGANGAVGGTTADASITPASGVMGNVFVIGKIGKAPAFTLLPIIVNAGTGGNVTIPTTPSPTLQVFLGGDVWHIGQRSQTGLTNAGVALPDVTATGNVSVDATGNTHVNLVSLGRTKVRGLANSDTAAPSFLRLVYAPTVPEPGTLMLLGAGVAGLALMGRRKL